MVVRFAPACPTGCAGLHRNERRTIAGGHPAERS